jgi:flagella basal body P-ring formation protein FlgA
LSRSIIELSKANQPERQSPARRLARALVAALAAALLTASQSLAASDNSQDLARLTKAGEDWLRSLAGERYPGTTIEVRVTPPDARLRLVACVEPRFFLAPGSKPWGGGSLGLRCESPAVWSLYTPFQIKLTGLALVSKRAFAARQPIAEDDVELRQIEYIGAPETHLRDPRQLRGAVPTMPIQAGAPLRNEVLHRPPIIKAGQKVRILVDGPGFKVSQEGVAQQAGAAGETIRLKTAAGRMIQGKIEADGRVRIEP